MKVLFVGDVVGPEATRYLADRLPGLRREHEVDLVVTNAENCGPSGVGMSAEGVDLLLQRGADIITAGNHAFDGPDAGRVLRHPRVLRPLNLGNGVPGKGLLSFEAGGEQVTVMVLADAAALALAKAVYHAAIPPYESWLSAKLSGTVIVDFHAQSVMEKQAFAFAVDGEAAAVLGTHTHEPTLRLPILPGGTAMVTEVGMTGAVDGPQGFDQHRFVARLKNKKVSEIPPVRPATGPMALGAVLLRIDGGKARCVERL